MKKIGKDTPVMAGNGTFYQKSITLYRKTGAIALSYLPRVRVRATVKLSATFFHDESSRAIEGGYESAIASKNIHNSDKTYGISLK